MNHLKLTIKGFYILLFQNMINKLNFKKIFKKKSSHIIKCNLIHYIQDVNIWKSLEVKITIKIDIKKYWLKLIYYNLNLY